MVTTTQSIAASPGEVIEQHSLRATVGFHLLPGLLILAVTVAALPLVTAAGLPPIAALMVGILLAQLPTQLGHLLIVAWRRNGRLSLDGVVHYRRRLRRWQYPLLVTGILLWSGLFFTVLAPVSTVLLNTVFAWTPSGFTATSSSDAASLSAYPRTALLVTFGAMVLLNGVAAPIVEELYFRGYLLPRLSRLGNKAPVLHTVLFSLYHFWQPWFYLTILVATAAFIFPVHWTRNIYVGMWAHSLLNLVGNLAIAGLVLSGGN